MAVRIAFMRCCELAHALCSRAGSHQASVIYVILDIRDHGSNTGIKPLVWLKGGGQDTLSTPKFGVETGFLLRRLQKGESLGLSAFPAHAIDWLAMPRTPDQR